MSVAFRRESDEEHLEPRFELPIPPGPNLVTERGYALIMAKNEELERLLADVLPERREELLRERRYWRSRLASAQVAPVPNGEVVALGTTVAIKQGERLRTLQIVGHDESDPAAGKIAYSAPLARLLIGREEGDEIDVPGQETIVIVSVEISRS